MSDTDDLTIDIAIGTRATMNTSTPRVGPWTYHHVLPVRIYFMVAWTIIRVLKHPDVWKSVSISGREALLTMCQYKANMDAIRVFLSDTTQQPTAPNIASHAKLCGSPPGGGFGGPNPSQRSDDPHDMPERFSPISAPAAWGVCLRTLGEAIRDAYTLRRLPQTNTTVSATHKVYEWCQIVLTMAGHLRGIDDLGAPRFEPSDWMTDSGHPWTLLTGQTALNNPNITVKLRGRRDNISYHALNGQLPHGLLRLQRHEDFLKLPPPPPPGG